MKSSRRPRSAARQPAQPRKAPAPPFPGAWSVVLIDGEPARKKARRDYSKVLRDIDAAKAERERYHSVDQPEYRKWLNANFGQTLTSIRELGQKLYETEALIAEVQDEFFFSEDDDIGEAYRRVKERRENPGKDTAGAESGRRENADGEEELEDEFRKLFEEMFGKEDEGPFGQDDSQRQERFSGRRQADLPFAEREQNSRIKDLYRQLVRRLHPDHVENLTAQQVEWWHQTQVAYNESSVEKLEMLLVLTDIEKDGAKEASVGLLAKITLEFKRALRVLKGELSRFKRDPAWKFSTIEDRRAIHKRTEFMLEMQKAQLTKALAQQEMQIRCWEETQPRGRRRRSRRRPTVEDEFLF